MNTPNHATDEQINSLWEGHMSEPDVARDAGPMNENEAIITLDFHANKAAHRGDYGLHDDLRKVAELIERMAGQRDELEIERDEARNAGSDLMRRLMAGRESLSKPL